MCNIVIKQDLVILIPHEALFQFPNVFFCHLGVYLEDLEKMLKRTSNKDKLRVTKEVALKFKQIKREKIDKLHKKLQGKSTDSVQHVHIIEDQELPQKKITSNTNFPQTQGSQKDGFLKFLRTVVDQDGTDIQKNLEKKVRRNVTYPTMSVDDFLGACKGSNEGESHSVQHQSSRDIEEKFGQLQSRLAESNKEAGEGK